MSDPDVTWLDIKMKGIYSSLIGCTLMYDDGIISRETLEETFRLVLTQYGNGCYDRGFTRGVSEAHLDEREGRIEIEYDPYWDDALRESDDDESDDWRSDT